MNRHSFTTTLAVLLAVTFIAPSLFFIMPQRAQAQTPVTVTSEISPTAIKRTAESTISAIKNTLTEINTATTAWAQKAAWWNANVLQPLAFVLSGNLMKALTAGVIAFVIGKANGTGVPQFAADVMGSLQTVADSQALAYLNQFGTNSNSPFAYSISSALRTNYLQKTTLAGFWSANRSTLSQYSPNQNAFLAGNWSQGGVAAWFALTTQSQNNPYTFYQNSEQQLATLVGPGIGGATGARVAELNWGQGFLGWCDPNEESITEDNAAEMEEEAGVNPGDPCVKDGKPGIIKTPGSTIKATLDKVLGGQQDQIVRMGNIGPQVNQILGNIASVMQTVQFASQILGGSDSGGLLGFGQTSGSNSTSRLIEYQNTTGNLGVTNATVYQGAANLPVSGADKLEQVAQYESAWSTIKISANAASTSVVSLANFCTAAADTAAQAQLNSGESYLYSPGQQDLSTVHSVFIDAAREQAVAAQTALLSVIAPVLARGVTAESVIAAARAAVQELQEALASGEDSAAESADLQTLQDLTPTASDVANIQQEVQVFGLAEASPSGSLNVSGGSLVDQMNLISTNSATLKTTVCNPSSSLYVMQEFFSG